MSATITGLEVSPQRLASPVAVLTVNHQGRVHGTTVSTLTWFSHRPPLIGAALRKESVFARLVAGEERFAVNVLDGSQGVVARWFASRSRPEGVEQFAAVQWERDPYSDAPLLAGALAYYACRFTRRCVVGDHDVLLGEVVNAHDGGGTPLLSYAGDLFATELRPAAARVRPAGDVRETTP